MVKIDIGKNPDTLPALEEILDNLIKQTRENSDLLIEKMVELIEEVKEITRR